MTTKHQGWKYMWHENKTRKKCVTRLLLRVSPVLGHSYNTEFGWD